MAVEVNVRLIRSNSKQTRLIGIIEFKSLPRTNDLILIDRVPSESGKQFYRVIDIVHNVYSHKCYDELTPDPKSCPSNVVESSKRINEITLYVRATDVFEYLR